MLEFIREKSQVWESLKESNGICFKQRCFGGWIGEHVFFFQIFFCISVVVCFELCREVCDVLVVVWFFFF